MKKDKTTGGYYGLDDDQKEFFEKLNRERDNRLSPYACKNAAAIYRKPIRNCETFRTTFNRDADTILFSTMLRRYDERANPFYRCRSNDLLKRTFHTCIVTNLSRQIGVALNLNCDLIEAIASALDAGRTPFGKKGEAYLSECYFSHTGRRFHHSVQSARIYRSVLNCNVSLQVLNGILCHDGELAYNGYAPSPMESLEEFDRTMERCYIEEGYSRTLRPSTLEGCVVRLCDYIAQIADGPTEIYRSHIVPDRAYTYDAIPSYKNKDFINHLAINLVKNSIDSPSLNMDQEVFFNMQALIRDRNVALDGEGKLNALYEEVIKPLMTELYDRLLHDIAVMDYDSPVFAYMKDKIQGRGYFDCDPIVKITEDPNNVVTDFIASMTDDYFIDVCCKLHVNDKLKIPNEWMRLD